MHTLTGDAHSVTYNPHTDTLRYRLGDDRIAGTTITDLLERLCDDLLFPELGLPCFVPEHATLFLLLGRDISLVVTLKPMISPDYSVAANPKHDGYFARAVVRPQL